MKIPRLIISEYHKWHSHWDDLCNRCGQCCYTRHLSNTGKIIVNYADPCKFLDKETKLCLVFDNRFRRCGYCGHVNLFAALFHPLLPENCAYVKSFRVWRQQH